MSHIHQRVYSLLLSCGILLLTACTSSTSTQENYSGFLNDYSQLQKVKLADGVPTMRWVSPDLKGKHYRKIFIDPVIVYPAPKSSKQVHYKLILDAASYLEQAVAQQIRGAGMEVVDYPAPGALRLHAAITTVESKAEGMKVYEVIPIAAIVAGVSAATGARDRNVEAFMEVEVTDIDSGAVMARAVKKGISENTLENDKTQVQVNDLKPTLDRWAKDAAVFAETMLK